MNLRWRERFFCGDATRTQDLPHDILTTFARNDFGKAIALVAIGGEFSFSFQAREEGGGAVGVEEGGLDGPVPGLSELARVGLKLGTEGGNPGGGFSRLAQVPQIKPYHC